MPGHTARTLSPARLTTLRNLGNHPGVPAANAADFALELNDMPHDGGTMPANQIGYMRSSAYGKTLGFLLPLDHSRLIYRV
jgi:hypothetical protein